MNLNLNNKVVRFITTGANLSDGCNITRTMLLWSLLIVGAVAALLVVLAGATVWVIAFNIPSVYEGENYKLAASLTAYFGAAWWIYPASISAIVSYVVGGTILISLAAFLAVGVVFAVVVVASSSGVGQKFVQVVNYTAGKLCPNFTFSYPPSVEAMMVKDTYVLSGGGTIFQVTGYSNDARGVKLHLVYPKDPSLTTSNTWNHDTNMWSFKMEAITPTQDQLDNNPKPWGWR